MDITEVLQSTPYICYEPTSWGGLHAKRYLDDNGLALTPLFSLDGLEAIAVLVGQRRYNQALIRALTASVEIP